MGSARHQAQWNTYYKYLKSIRLVALVNTQPCFMLICLCHDVITAPSGSPGHDVITALPGCPGHDVITTLPGCPGHDVITALLV